MQKYLQMQLCIVLEVDAEIATHTSTLAWKSEDAATDASPTGRGVDTHAVERKFKFPRPIPRAWNHESLFSRPARFMPFCYLVDSKKGRCASEDISEDKLESSAVSRGLDTDTDTDSISVDSDTRRVTLHMS